jgi:hypothetical protein
MKTVRRIHGWLGVLFAPSIILFAFTGALQLFGLHETERGEAPGVVAKLAMIHTHQTMTIPQRAARPPAPPAPRTDAPPQPKSEPPSTLPLKLFFLVMALALITSSMLGVWIAFVSKRDQKLHVALLAAGIVLPIVVLMV